MPKPNKISVPICHICNMTYQNEESLQFHKWEEHPTDIFQKLWSEEKKKGFPNIKSSYYRDDPYY